LDRAHSLEFRGNMYELNNHNRYFKYLKFKSQIKSK